MTTTLIYPICTMLAVHKILLNTNYYFCYNTNIIFGRLTNSISYLTYHNYKYSKKNLLNYMQCHCGSTNMATHFLKSYWLQCDKSTLKKYLSF